MLSIMENSSTTRRLRFEPSALDQALFAASFPSALDWMAVAWHGDVLHGVAFGYASQRQARFALARGLYRSGQFWRFPGLGQLTNEPAWLQELVSDLQQFAEGEPVDFRYVPISEEHLTRFGHRVTAACRAISWGQTTTYGELAEKCGSPAAARAVGTVMARNRFPLVVPCHRVLAAGGALGGYSAPDGLNMKRRLLAMEGRGSLE